MIKSQPFNLKTIVAILKNPQGRQAKNCRES